MKTSLLLSLVIGALSITSALAGPQNPWGVDEGCEQAIKTAAINYVKTHNRDYEKAARENADEESTIVAQISSAGQVYVSFGPNDDGMYVDVAFKREGATSCYVTSAHSGENS
jgi:hypothetical protein